MTVRDRRMLSNSISVSEKVNSISDAAALLYTWNVSHLDDDGRGDRSVFYLKTKVFPGRDHAKEGIAQLREEIIKEKLMIPYDINGHEYWYMPKETWEFHQRGSWQGRRRKPSSVPMPNTEKKGKQCSGSLKIVENSDRTDNRSKEKLSKEKLSKEKIYTVFDFWNEQKIMVHKKIEKHEGVIKSALKDFSEEEIKDAISNYKTIREGKEYFFNYKWTLKEFLQRGLEKFLTVNDPFTNYLKDTPAEEVETMEQIIERRRKEGKRV